MGIIFIYLLSCVSLFEIVFWVIMHQKRVVITCLVVNADSSYKLAMYANAYWDESKMPYL